MQQGFLSTLQNLPNKYKGNSQSRPGIDFLFFHILYSPPRRSSASSSPSSCTMGVASDSTFGEEGRASPARNCSASSGVTTLDLDSRREMSVTRSTTSMFQNPFFFLPLVESLSCFRNALKRGASPRVTQPSRSALRQRRLLPNSSSSIDAWTSRATCSASCSTALSTRSSFCDSIIALKSPTGFTPPTDVTLDSTRPVSVSFSSLTFSSGSPVRRFLLAV
mmetsp:Transcript_14585/g.41442  ORF Transcript_14585/g.41442 Transcript_14585/m.41442 type:complete len:221 (-) Transcript_14585:1854-2516(-)